MTTDELISILHEEACRCYNDTLPKTEETEIDSWYYEGQKTAYWKVLEILKGNKEIIQDIESLKQ